MEILNKLIKAVNSNSSGHLPLKHRVALMKELNNSKLTNKLYFECAKKVFPIWEEEYEGSTPVYEILQKAYAYLYSRKGKKADFLKLANDQKNHLESIDGSVGAAGLAALYLCYCICTDTKPVEGYNGKDDDNAFDYEDWAPDYYASMAYSGAPAFFGEGSIERRKEFWLWFIDTAEALIANPQKPVITLEEKQNAPQQQEQISRTQSYEDGENMGLIQETIQMTIDFLKEKNQTYEAFRLESRCMSLGTISRIYLINNGKEEKLILSVLDWFGFTPARVLYKVKDNMYQQAPEEGAWLNSSLTVDQQGNFTLEVNYDDRDRLYDADAEKVLPYEFEEYPRRKEYTPKWLQAVLGKKAKYL